LIKLVRSPQILVLAMRIMTKRISLPVIVEGVETEEHVRFLKSLGCHYVQGFYFYKPMPVEEFETLIGDEKNVDRTGFVYRGNTQLRIGEFTDEAIYSDAMLNNIIGAVAFYSGDGEERVDIIRYNEQFRNEVADPAFDSRLRNIMEFIPPEDRPVMASMLRAAEEDRLNGATGVVGVYRSNGELGHFLLHVYYLEEQSTGKVYYAALRDISDQWNLQHELRLLSHVYQEDVIILHRRVSGWEYRVAIHGLRDQLDADRLSFQASLNDGTFLLRARPEDRESLRRVLIPEPTADRETVFRLTDPGEGVHTFRMKIVPTQDQTSDIEFIAILWVED